MNLKNAKILVVFAGCLLLRFVPFRAPNVEPIMSAIMPVSKKYGVISGFLFGFLSIFIYDLFTSFGPWTLTAGIAYGIVGAGASFYFNKHKGSVSNFILFSFVATIFFDLTTGVLLAPMWGQSILNAFVFQIPFTVLHLAGNIGFALTISPLINMWLSREEIATVSLPAKIFSTDNSI